MVVLYNCFGFSFTSTQKRLFKTEQNGTKLNKIKIIN